MRARAVVIGIAAIVLGCAVALGLFILGAIFALNGEQWRWWTPAAWAGAAVVLVVALLRGAGQRAWRLSAGVWAAVGLCGAMLAVLSITIMARRYSDPYNGPLFWPHALAVAAFLGFALSVVVLALWSGRRPAT